MSTVSNGVGPYVGDDFAQRCIVRLIVHGADDAGRTALSAARPEQFGDPFNCIVQAALDVALRHRLVTPDAVSAEIYDQLPEDDARAVAGALISVLHDEGAEHAIRDEGPEYWLQKLGVRATPDAEAWPLLRDLVQMPELLAPPESVVPRVAHRGRATLLVGRPKLGKSTFAAHGARALTCGSWWLGEKIKQGRVVWCGPDEAIGDTVRRLHGIEADSGRVRILHIRPPDLLGSMRALLAAWPSDLVVVDSLAEWARIVCGQAPDDGDAARWGLVTRPLVQIARDFDCALLLLHHPRKSDDQYRGSTEIAASVDCVLEMIPPQAGEDQALRRIRGRARWAVEPYAVTLNDGRYELVGGPELSIDTRVLMHVERLRLKGTTMRDLREIVGGRASAVDDAIRMLLERGAIVRGSDQRLYPGMPQLIDGGES